MFKINCRELTEESCDFSVDGASIEEVKEKFYAHGAASPLHQEKYYSATKEEAAIFSKKLDEYLSKQIPS